MQNEETTPVSQVPPQSLREFAEELAKREVLIEEVTSRVISQLKLVEATTGKNAWVDETSCQPGSPHFHRDERGFLVKCFHGTRNLFTDWRFWLGVTISFPLEHGLYEFVWPFTIVGKMFGM